jgi:hypothetical protein
MQNTALEESECHWCDRQGALVHFLDLSRSFRRTESEKYLLLIKIWSNNQDKDEKLFDV